MKKRKSISLCKYHRISSLSFFLVSPLVNIIAAFIKIFSARHSNNLYFYEPVFLTGIVNVNFGRRSWIKIWNLRRISPAGTNVYTVQIRSIFWSAFPVFRLNTEIYYLNLRIQSEYRKITTRKYSIFRHFSRSEDEDEVKSYNEKFLNLICTSTDVIQQIICLIHFVEYETNLWSTGNCTGFCFMKPLEILWTSLVHSTAI